MPSSYDTHGFIDWYEPVHKTISYLPEVVKEVQTAANRLGRRASFLLNTDTGDARIEVIHKGQANKYGGGPDLDSYVLLVATDEIDPDNKKRKQKGWPAAMSIEMGAKNGGGGNGPLRGAVDELAKGVKQH